MDLRRECVRVTCHNRCHSVARSQILKLCRGWFAYERDIQTSPGGIALHNSKRFWDNVDRVTAAQIDAYRKTNGLEADDGKW